MAPDNPRAHARRVISSGRSRPLSRHVDVVHVGALAGPLVVRPQTHGGLGVLLRVRLLLQLFDPLFPVSLVSKRSISTSDPRPAPLPLSVSGRKGAPKNHKTYLLL